MALGRRDGLGWGRGSPGPKFLRALNYLILVNLEFDPHAFHPVAPAPFLRQRGGWVALCKWPFKSPLAFVP